MLFSVVVPYFSHLDHMPLTLMSIATQTCRDFEVVVVDDASPNSAEGLCQEMSKYMPQPIRYIHFDENKGIGVNRQRALDAAKGDYITSIDSDDLFYHCEVLETYKRNIDAQKAQGKIVDVLHGQFMEAHAETGIRNPHQPMDGAWVHGKAYRVQFLKDNKITFPEYIYYEDGGFNHVVGKLAAFQVAIPDVMYLWTHTANSIVRSGEYIYRMLPMFADSFWRAYKITEPVKGRDNVSDLILNEVVMCYYYLQGLERRYPADDTQIAKVYEVLKATLDDTKIIDRINNDERYYNAFKQILQTGRAGAYNQDPYLVEDISFNDWLKLHFGVSILKLEKGAIQGVRDTGTKVSMYADRTAKEKTDV